MDGKTVLGCLDLASNANDVAHQGQGGDISSVTSSLMRAGIISFI